MGKNRGTACYRGRAGTGNESHHVGIYPSDYVIFICIDALFATSEACFVQHFLRESGKCAPSV